MKIEKLWAFALTALIAGVLAMPYTYADELPAPTLPNFLKPVPQDLIVAQTTMEYKYIHVAEERIRVGMDALISYVQTVGGSTATLDQLKSAFVSKDAGLKASAESATDYAAWKSERISAISDMKKAAADFKIEVKAQVGNNTAGARTALNAALESNKAQFSLLLTEAREAQKERNLKAFDYMNSQIQAWIDGAKANGTDVSAVQAKLDEIEGKRTELVSDMDAAITSCNGIGVLLGTAACNTAEVQAYVALRSDLLNKYKELRELAKQAGQGKKIGDAITKGRGIIANAETTLANAESKGRDVSSYRTSLNEIKGMVDSADSKYKSGDYTGATNDLKSAQSAFQALKQSARPQ